MLGEERMNSQKHKWVWLLHATDGRGPTHVLSGLRRVPLLQLPFLPARWGLWKMRERELEIYFLSRRRRKMCSGNYRVPVRISNIPFVTFHLFHFDADPDPELTFTLMRIRMRIQLSKMMRIRIRDTGENVEFCSNKLIKILIVSDPGLLHLF